MCEQSTQLQAYYDGELGEDQRRQFEAHLRDCAPCSAKLEQLRAMSQMLRAVPLPEVPVAAMARFRATLQPARDRWQDRSVMRLAGWLTSAAAAVLVGSLIIQRPDVAPEQSKPLAAAWETAAVIDASVSSPPTQYADAGESDTARFAQWMVEDLSRGQRR